MIVPKWLATDGLRAILLAFILCPYAAYAANIAIIGKHLRSDGTEHEFQVLDGDALSPGDRFQIVIDTSETIYYSILYVSREGGATQIFPPGDKQGQIGSGGQQIIPSPEHYFTLDARGGRELMFVVVSNRPIGGLKSAIAGVSGVTNDSREILQYLSSRLPGVHKLEITNTGNRLVGFNDQVSSGLVRDIEATYRQNPWPESFTSAIDTRKKARRRSDDSIPDAVRERAAEVRAMMKRRDIGPSSSLHTVSEEQPASLPAEAPPQADRIRRDAPMLKTNRRQQELADQARRAEERQQLEEARQEELRRQESLLAAQQRQLEEQEAAQQEELLQQENRQQQALADRQRVLPEQGLQHRQQLSPEQVQPDIEQSYKAEQQQLAQQERQPDSLSHSPADQAQPVPEEIRDPAASSGKPQDDLDDLSAQEQETESEQQQPGGLLGKLASIFGGSDQPAADTESHPPVDSTGEVITPGSQQPPEPAPQADEQPSVAVVALQAPARPVQPKAVAAPPARIAKVRTALPDEQDRRALYEALSASIVAISSSAEPEATGFVLDEEGHILTSWHAINDATEVDIRFTGVAGASPVFRAQVIKTEKFRDLALLKLVDPPAGIQPATLATGDLPDAGTKVRVFGQKDGRVWATNDGVITRVARNFTWFSKSNVIHRGEILQIDLPDSGKGVGSLVTSLDYRVLGIRSFSGKETGRTYAVSTANILQFLKP